MQSYRLHAENDLITQVVNLCKQLDPNYTNWNFFAKDQSNRTKWLNFVRSQTFKDQTAEAFLTAVYQKIQTQGCQIFTKSQIHAMMPAYVTSCQAGLSLRQFFWEQFITEGFDLTQKSRANFLWDEQILFFVGRQVRNNCVVLVTSIL